MNGGTSRLRAGMAPSLKTSTLSPLPELECTLLDIRIVLAGVVRNREEEKSTSRGLSPPT